MTSNVTTALAKLGGSRGIREVRSRGTDGDIEIEIKFRPEPSSPLVTYLLSIGENNGRAVINREILKYTAAMNVGDLGTTLISQMEKVLRLRMKLKKLVMRAC